MASYLFNAKDMTIAPKYKTEAGDAREATLFETVKDILMDPFDDETVMTGFGGLAGDGVLFVGGMFLGAKMVEKLPNFFKPESMQEEG